MAIKKNAGKKNLRPQAFVKGQSGNPAGRPPMKEVQQIFKDFLLGEAEFKDAKGKATKRVRLEMIMQRLFKDAMAGKASSTDILLERGLGKAKATVAHEGLSDIDAITTEQRAKIMMAAFEEMKLGAKSDKPKPATK